MPYARRSIVIVFSLCAVLVTRFTYGNEKAAEAAADKTVDTAAAEGLNESEQPTLTTYTPPARINRVPPNYPAAEQRRSGEGWVSLNFMVSPEGKPYEITVADSIGGKGFEKAAIASIKKWTYQPALLDGKPIDAGSRVSLAFAIQGGAPGARPSFVSRWKETYKLIEAGERDLAKQSLDTLEPKNLYEDAYHQLGIAIHALKWGDAETVKRAARRALMRARVSDGATYLPKDSLRSVTQTLMVAQWNTRDFVGALETATELRQDEEDPTKVANLDKLIRAVENMRKEPGHFKVEGTIGEDYSWQMDLLKNRFSISVESGRLAEIKLYCPTRYVGFPFDAAKEYTVTAQHGFCRLEVIGDAGSQFTLNQR